MYLYGINYLKNKFINSNNIHINLFTNHVCPHSFDRENNYGVDHFTKRENSHLRLDRFRYKV